MRVIIVTYYVSTEGSSIVRMAAVLHNCLTSTILQTSFISSAVQSIQYNGSILVQYLRNILSKSLWFCENIQ